MDNGTVGSRVCKVMNTDSFITFGDAEVENTEYAAARIVILPLCYEAASSYGTGSGQGREILALVQAQTIGGQLGGRSRDIAGITCRYRTNSGD